MVHCSNCHVVLCRARHAADSDRAATLRAFEDELVNRFMVEHGSRLTVVPHLYDLTDDGPTAERLRSLDGHLVVLAWLPSRATYWLLRRLGIRGARGDLEDAEERQAAVPDLADAAGGVARRIWCMDLRKHSRAEACAEAVDQVVSEITAGPQGSVAAGRGPHTGPLPEGEGTLESTRARWYPVVDYDRCANCLECLNFCLFGVYGLDASEVLVVEQPDACRPGCPACARVCPNGAIMFPEHADPTISGGTNDSLGRQPGESDQPLKVLDPFRPAGRDQIRLDDLVDEVDDLDV